MAVRRVRRVIRRIDPWTVLKISLVFNAIAGLTFVLGVWVVWSLLLQRGVPDRIVEIFEAIRITIAVDGRLYFRIVVFLAVVGSIAMTALMTLGAVLYNLIADLVGGVELSVLEETYQPTAQPAVKQRMRPAVHVPTSGNGGSPTPQRSQQPPKSAPTPEAPAKTGTEG
ncbi:MAG: DUF3566 domain-containing protein [Acidimicrobiia bacterium]